MPMMREYGGAPSEHPIWQDAAVSQLLDTRRGKPGWITELIDGFIDVRDKTVKDTWEAVDELYRKETESLGTSRRGLGIAGRMIRPPRVYGYMQMLESQLYSRNPKFLVEPMSARQEKLAIYAEQHANAHWHRSKRLSQEMHLCLRDVAKHGWSWVQTSYTPREGENVKRERKRRSEIARQLQDPMIGPVLADQIATALYGPDSVGLQATVPTFERDDRSMRGIISSRRVPSWMVACDPNGHGTDDIEWWARQIIAPIQAWKQNPSFKNVKNLKPTGVMRSFEQPHTGRQQYQQELGNFQPYQYVAGWEVFIRDEEGLWDQKIFAEGEDQFVYEEQHPYDVGLPVALLRWNHDGDHLLTPSDIQQVLDLITEESQLRTRLFDSAMRAMNHTAVVDLRKIGGEAGLRGIVNIPGVGTVIPIQTNGTAPLDSYFKYLQKPSDFPELIAYLGILERNIELGLGLGPNQQLSALKSETSATEAAEIAQSSRSRSVVKHKFFEDFVAEVEHISIGCGFQFYGPEMFAHTVSREGLAFLLGEEFTTGDIQHGLAITVEKGSMQPPDTMQRIQLYTAMLTEGMANPVLAQLYNMPEIARRRAHEMGVMDGSEMLLPVSGPDMATAMMQDHLMQTMLGGGGGSSGGSPPKPAGESNTNAVQSAASGGLQ